MKIRAIVSPYKYLELYRLIVYSSSGSITFIWLNTIHGTWFRRIVFTRKDIFTITCFNSNRIWLQAIDLMNKYCHFSENYEPIQSTE